MASAAVIMSPYSVACPNLRLLPTAAQVLPAQLGVRLEPARGEDHRLGAELDILPCSSVARDPDHPTLVEKQPRPAYAVTHRRRRACRGRSVVLNESLAATDVAQVKTTPEEVAPVRAQVGLSFVHEPIAQAVAVQPPNAVQRLGGDDLRSWPSRFCPP